MGFQIYDILITRLPASFYLDVLGIKLSKLKFISWILILFFCHDTKEPKSLGLIEILHINTPR